MPVRFRKISEERIDETRVTLHVFAGPGGSILGRVSTLAFDAGTYSGGQPKLMTTEGIDPPIATALEFAKELAAFKEESVDVVDPGRLWQADWGKLED